MLLKEEKITGNVFSDGILGQFDIYYSREDRKTNKNISFEKNQKGLIVKLGNRKGNNCCRIYKEKTSLKFEYEMKEQLFRKYHNLLISNCLGELENLMC